MPYCPKCRTEFLPGIRTCSECGSTLVDELPEGEEIQVPDWEAMDEKERLINAQKEADQFLISKSDSTYCNARYFCYFYDCWCFFSSSFKRNKGANFRGRKLNKGNQSMDGKKSYTGIA